MDMGYFLSPPLISYEIPEIGSFLIKFLTNIPRLEASVRAPISLGQGPIASLRLGIFHRPDGLIISYRGRYIGNVFLAKIGYYS